MGKWENGNFGKNALSFPLSCHLLKVYICHASCHSICKIYKNRVVTFALVCLSENVYSPRLASPVGEGQLPLAI